MLGKAWHALQCSLAVLGGTAFVLNLSDSQLGKLIWTKILSSGLSLEASAGYVLSTGNCVIPGSARCKERVSPSAAPRPALSRRPQRGCSRIVNLIFSLSSYAEVFRKKQSLNEG